MPEQKFTSQVASFSKRGLEKNLRHIEKLSREVAIMALTETWLQASNKKILHALGKAVNVLQSEKLHRGYGRVGMIVSPLMKFKIILVNSTVNIQPMTFQIQARP